VVKVPNTPATSLANGLIPERYEFGRFRLDCRTRELWRGDEVVALTPKAFDLLWVLVTAGNRVVEKTDLMKLVWPDSFVSEDSLTHNIATLRKALGDLPDRPEYIVTVARHGYRFVAPVRVLSDEAEVATTPEDLKALSAPSPERRDAELPVEFPAGSPATGRPTATWWTRWQVAFITVTIFTATALAIWFLRRAPSTAPALTRFVVAAPEGTAFSASASFLAVSPNGRLLAFLAARPGEETRLWVRPLDSLTARELPGTNGALSPFWSPDSQFLGFVAHGQLKTVSLLGEPPRILCDLQPGSLPGATWSHDGVILFSQGNAISRIASNGGIPSPITSVDPQRGETAHILPQFLPDGRHFIYVARSGSGGSIDSWVVLGSIDGSENRRLIQASSQALYTDPGYLLFLSDGALLAQPFDAARLQMRGGPLPVPDTDHVGFNPATPRGMFSVSPVTLAYRPTPVRELGWYDRSGEPLGWIGAAGLDSDPALSPDGQRVAVSRYDPKTSTRNIWILDLGRSGVASPFTSHLAWANCPLWSSDGSRIVFASGRVSGAQLYEKRVDSATEARALPRHTTGCPLDWSPDGDLLYGNGLPSGSSGTSDVWLASTREEAEPKQLTGTWSIRPRPQLSPNGRWMAFSSDISGRNEIYVRSFPGADARPRQISARGGIEPHWRADGRELFFIGADKQLMAVPVTIESGFRAETPVALFMTDLDPVGLGISGRNQYAVSASGERFLMNQPRPGTASPPMTVLLNWTAAVSK
jgi:eukaryotic-like serine/threonine-protein kinase